MRLLLLSLAVCVSATAQPADSIYTFASEPAALLPSQEVAFAQIAAAFAYPAEAARDSVRGVVLLRVVVDTSGVPIVNGVLRSVGSGCDEAAARAVRDVRFRPARHEGRAVAQYVTLPVPCRPPRQAVLPFAPAAPAAPEPPPAPLTFETCTGVREESQLLDKGGLRTIVERLELPDGRPTPWKTTITFTVGTDGRPDDFRLDPPLPRELQIAVVRAVHPSRFAPATCDGEPVPHTVQLPMSRRMQR